MIKSIVIFLLLLFINSASQGQDFGKSKDKVLFIDSLHKAKFNNEDTLVLTVRNRTAVDRGFTIEAVSLSKESYYYDAVYSAFFNHDTAFFKTLRKTKKLSGKKNTQYVLPNYTMKSLSIKANGDTTICFIIKGSPIPNGISMKLKITSDIVNDHSDIAYFDSFQIFSLPK